MVRKKPRRGHGEGAIFWRESRKRWIAELKLENGKSKYFSGKTYAEAQRKLSQAKLEKQQGKTCYGPETDNECLSPTLVRGGSKAEY